jgi:5-methylcytosine-specific restriction endonuclease McrA
MDLSKPAQVKNLMRRGLRLLVDPAVTPEEKRRVYAFFENQCAFCGAGIAGKGDLDHLVPTSKNGSNHISNRVLSCGGATRRKSWIPTGWSFSLLSARATTISSSGESGESSDGWPRATMRP